MNGFHYARPVLTASQVSQWTNGTTLPNGSLPAAFDADVYFVGFGGVNDSNGTGYSTSPNGVGWRHRRWTSAISPAPYLLGLTYGQGRWVGITQRSEQYYALSTTDPRSVSWTNASASTDSGLGNMSSMKTNGTRFVAVGSTTYSFYSTDGISWTRVNNFSAYGGNTNLVWNGTYFITPNNSSATWARSTDGQAWDATTAISISNPSGAAANGAKILVTGNGTNNGAYSTDGVTWSTVTDGTNFNYTPSLSAGDGYFFYGINGTTTLRTSTDTAVWTTRTLPFSASWYNGGYHPTAFNGGKIFFIVGSSNRFAYSTDLITWTQGSYPTVIPNTIYAFAVRTT